MKFNFNDGGRSKYYRATNVGDCAVRSIAIGAQLDYKFVYNELKKLNNGISCRNGTPKKVDKKLLENLGWVKLPGVSGKGIGIRYHLNDHDLKDLYKKYPRMIVEVSRHLTCIVDGVLNDIYDCTREGTRGIYAIWVPSL